MTERDRERIKTTAEFFTPTKIVEDMLNSLPEEVWKEGTTFLDSSCGNGNFLVAILHRKLSLGHDPLIAIRSIYGTDIMEDNIKECRQRMLSLLHNLAISITREHCASILQNILWLKNGSESYSFHFKKKPSTEEVEELFLLSKI